MIFEKLGNLSKITSGGTPSRSKPEYFAHGDIPWVKTGDLGKKFVTEPLEKINNLGLHNSSAKVFPANTVLVAMYGATIGSCAILNFEASTNQACAAFLPSQRLNHEYLYYFLKSIKQTLISMGKGGGQPNISAGLLKNIEIPLLPLDDQIRIAHLLSKVEGLITQRKQHLQQLDDLIKSVFLEMFGDPVRNEKEWDITPCDRVVLDISSGTSYGGEDRPFESIEEIGVLKISSVTKGFFDPLEFKVVNRAQITKSLRFVKCGDFLFSRANTVELVAACCVVPKDYDQLFLPDKLWILTINEQLVKPQFLNYLLKNERYRDVVRNLANGGHDSMLNISMKKFMTLGIPCPSIDLQIQFAIIVEKVEALKSRYQQSLTDLEVLYGALSQQAFKGKLDLSRIPKIALLPRAETSISFNVQAVAPSVFPMPDSELLHAALIDRTQLTPLLHTWLESYRLRSDNESFSPEHFLSVAQTRLEELHPENDYPLGADAYEIVKKWVFEALDKGLLYQSLDETGKEEDGTPIFGNKLILKAKA